MQGRLKELQNPPEQLTELLHSEKKKREEFLNNTYALNNSFAFASVRAEKAPDDQLGGRADTCKYNGDFSFAFYDLIAPGGKHPLFAQTYTLTPEEAKILRPEHFHSALNRRVSQEIFNTLEDMMREHNPLAKTFATLKDKVKAVEDKTGKKAPHFQV